jgi:predicted phage terminase large subunit-like protein
MSTEQYIDIKSRISPSIWIAEYMQEPVDQKGRLFNSLKIMDKDEFKFIEKNFDGTIAYIDVSDQGKDYTAMAICGMIGQDIYVIDYVFSRENTDVTIPLCAEKLNKWKVGFCRVESNAMGAMFSRSLQHLTTTKILQVHNTVAKITRIIMQSATINNFTFLNNESLDCKQFMDNLIFFSKEGGNKNDDAPDCLAGLSMFMKAMFTNLNI